MGWKNWAFLTVAAAAPLFLGVLALAPASSPSSVINVHENSRSGGSAGAVDDHADDPGQGDPAPGSEEPAPVAPAGRGPSNPPADPATAFWWCREERPWLSHTVSTGEDGVAVITNAADLLAVVNKERRLPAGYEPPDLVIPEVPFTFEGVYPQRHLRRPAAEALAAMFDAAAAEGFTLYARSGYRTYEQQQQTFEANVARYGEERANQSSARPGESEHQTGLAMDVTTRAVGFRLIQSFGETPAGQWTHANAADFGFIVRYPRGREEETGYQFEPWHLRFVGVEAARLIFEHGLILEEYLAYPGGCGPDQLISGPMLTPR
ncbi:MAG: M15 family metallopeptidase [Thermaerobacterales bacterium]